MRRSVPVLTRRALLGSAGATLLGSCAAPAALPSPTPTPRTSVPILTGTPLASRSLAGPPDWETLRAQLRGSLVRPADAGYDAARLLYNTRFDGARPLAVARCGSVADVQACIAFARRSGVAITPRSGGHSYGGWSGGPGLVVDVGELATIQAGDTTIIGAGARLADTYAAVGARGRAIAAGSCPTVGIAGLTLGGGLGVLSRAWGLTCDSLVSVDIVTADGTARTCDAQRDPDLFWALRGGGGGNFGIVTSFATRTHPAPSLAIAFVTWPWAQAGTVLRAWQAWIATMPDRVWSNVHLDAGAGPQPSLLIHAVAMESDAALQAHLDQLVGAAGSPPEDRTVFTRPYGQAMLVEGGCAQLTPAQCHLTGTTPDGRLGRETFAAKSSIAPGPLSNSAIDAVVAGIDGLQALPNAGAGSVLIDAMGAAIRAIGPNETAFPHRDAFALVQFVASWDPSAPASVTGGSLAWLRAFYGSARPLIGQGAYVNYADPDLSDWQQAYYGANYARLREVRSRYDPDGVFAFPQAIR